ncbi:MAG: aminodeoxychorismate lyase [Rhodospirillaceae bacterium]|mgnify:CR=1 FL=1|nr:aminodeoxychorismate lyase [Rhodospirillaceae bacterium]
MPRALLFVGYLSLASLFLSIGLAIWGYAELMRPGPSEASRVVVVPRGAGLENIARILVAAGVVRRPEIIVLGAKLKGATRDLKAGEYRFPERVSPDRVIEILKTGETVVRRLTLAEGLTVSQIVEKLRKTDGLSGEIHHMPPEGSLLPETYHFSNGDQRAELIQRMDRGMRELVQGLWERRAKNLPYHTPEEAVVIASIIEKETALDPERELVAGVFVNRLREGMRLQSDPTVAYGLFPDGLGRPLTRADLRKPSPFNTYIIKGLPPSPICNPGSASIQAALNPANTDFLYFVADGRGGHAFARTLKQHNRNVARWREVRDGKTD